MKNETARATVMVVDDTPANLRHLQEMMRDKGYRVVAFPEGKAALNAAAKRPPDIILLDILMPEMDGFEVCSRLKADPGLSKIPVLFISALTDGDDKARAFAVGGVDYVTKPFEEKEVLSRVETHLRLSRLSQDLENSVQERTAQLLESNQSLQEEIATRKQAEEQLEKSRGLLQSVFDGISDPLFLMDSAFQLQIMNAAASDYFNASFQEALGRPCYELISDRAGNCPGCKIKYCLNSNERISFERPCCHDPHRTEEVEVFPLKTGLNGGSVIVHLKDVTMAKRLEQELLQADKLAALGTLVGGVAHEINNPLGLITMNVPMLQTIWERLHPVLEPAYARHNKSRILDLEYTELQEKITGLFDQVMGSARKLKGIVGDLKDFARQETSDMNQTVDLNQLIETTINLTANTIKKATDRFSVTLYQSPVYVTGNFQKLEQVLVNLLINACEALENKNQAISISLDVVYRKTARIQVRDEGPGIPQQHLRHIFDPFFSTKQDLGGTGLGLSVSTGIIKAHKGRIEFDPQEGQGTLCSILLPMTTALEN